MRTSETYLSHLAACKGARYQEFGCISVFLAIMTMEEHTYKRFISLSQEVGRPTSQVTANSATERRQMVVERYSSSPALKRLALSSTSIGRYPNTYLLCPGIRFTSTWLYAATMEDNAEKTWIAGILPKSRGLPVNAKVTSGLQPEDSRHIPRRTRSHSHTTRNPLLHHLDTWLFSVLPTTLRSSIPTLALLYCLLSIWFFSGYISSGTLSQPPSPSPPQRGKKVYASCPPFY